MHSKILDSINIININTTNISIYATSILNISVFSSKALDIIILNINTFQTFSTSSTCPQTI